MRLLVMFATNLLGYTLLYISYSYGAKTPAGRVVWVAASVIGMLIGSTAGKRWFRQ